MVRKTASPAKSRNSRLKQSLPKVANGPPRMLDSRSKRRVELEARMAARGVQPIEDYERYLEQVTDFWPAEESCDEFLTWLRESRREGK